MGVVLAVALVTTVVAPASAETLRFRLRGQEAVAAFSSTDPTGCIVTNVFVAAMDAAVKDGPGQAQPDSRSFAVVSQYDTCTHVELLDAFGEEVNLPADAFVISELQSATLNATIDVVDHVSGASVPLSVSLSWTADGEPSRIRDHYQVKAPGYTVNAKFSATSRAAEAHGTVLAGTTNLTPVAADFALLNSIKAGALEIVR